MVSANMFVSTPIFLNMHALIPMEWIGSCKSVLKKEKKTKCIVVHSHVAALERKHSQKKTSSMAMDPFCFKDVQFVIFASFLHASALHVCHRQRSRFHSSVARF